MVRSSNGQKQRWRNVLIGVFLALGLALVAGFGARSIWMERDERHAPLVLQQRNGTVLDLKKWAGRPVLVHFWASWCPPCLEEIEAFLRAGKALSNRPGGPIFLAVAVDQNWSKVDAIVPSARWPDGVIAVLDPDGKTAEAWGSFQYPETYGLDSKHRLVKKWVGQQDWDAVVKSF